MPRDKDQGNKRIEGIFGQIGLGNLDPEKIRDIQEQYEKAMALADFMKSKKGTRFGTVMRTVEAEAEKQEKAPKEKKKS
jgi:hypothetical protein